MISTQVWRTPREKISINALKERTEETIRVYAKENCSMGKYIPVQTNQEITGEVLIEVNDKTIPGLVMPEVIYNIKKKLGWIYAENHIFGVYSVEERKDCRISAVMCSDKRGARSNTGSAK